MKDDDSGVYDDPGSFSGLAVFNAIPNSAGVSLLLDGDRLNLTHEKLSFGGHLSHRNVYPGAKSLAIDNFDTKGNFQRVVHHVALTSGAIYSLFLYEDNGVQSVLSNDNMVSPASGYAKVRFVHMVKDAPALTMNNGGGAEIVHKNISFKTVTDFIEMKAEKPITFKIVPDDLEKTLPEIILNDFKLEDRGIYTFLVKGLINTSNEKEQISLTVIKF